MDNDRAAEAFAGLSHPKRLQIFCLLMKEGPNGLPAGKIAQAVGMPASTLSFHLSQMTSACLLTPRRNHRQIIYRAEPTVAQTLAAVLLSPKDNI